MTKEELIQLTNEVYGLTLLFPKKEPLRNKLRAVADDILAEFISQNDQSQKATIVGIHDWCVKLKNIQKAKICEGLFSGILFYRQVGWWF